MGQINDVQWRDEPFYVLPSELQPGDVIKLDEAVPFGSPKEAFWCFEESKDCDTPGYICLMTSYVDDMEHVIDELEGVYELQCVLADKEIEVVGQLPR